MSKQSRKRRRKLRNEARRKRGEVIALYGRNCAYCSVELREGEPNGSPVQFTIDHVRALSRGGTNDIENLRPACPGCNQARGNGGGASVAPKPPAKPPAPLRGNVIELTLECEDEQGRRELRLARANALGVTDARFRPGGKAKPKIWSIEDERALTREIRARCGPRP